MINPTHRPRLDFRGCGLFSQETNRWQDALALAGTHHDPILRTDEGRPWYGVLAYHRLVTLRTKLGMGPELNLISARHAMATDAIERGTPLADIAMLLGHKTTAMVERHYGHLGEKRDRLISVVDRIRPES